MTFRLGAPPAPPDTFDGAAQQLFDGKPQASPGSSLDLVCPAESTGCTGLLSCTHRHGLAITRGGGLLEGVVMGYDMNLAVSHAAVAAEASRAEAVRRYNILDTGPEEAFDRIARMAKLALQASVVLVSLIDSDRQWVKSAQGLVVQQLPLQYSLCHQVIRLAQPLMVQDCREDDRFSSNPFVTGDPNIRFYMGVPLRTFDGYDIGTVCAIDDRPREPSPDQLAIMHDLARMVMDELELRLMASVDSLTGALTRRVFHQRANQAMHQGRGDGPGLSIVALDLDHFKQVNDHYGHAAGDQVLRGLVDCCRPTLRATDQIARLGGEEFAILLPDTSSLAAQAIAERLRIAVAGMTVATANGPFSVTASLGVASQGRHADVAAVLAAADGALYRAKREGRNRTIAA